MSNEINLDKLTEENQKEYKKKVKEKKKKIEEKLKNEKRDTIDNQIKEDENELRDFNIIICSFQERDDVNYTFIRTEPLFHEGEKNFDVMLGNPKKKIGVFIECERSLISGLSKKLKEFKAESEVIKQNEPDFNVDSYLKKCCGSKFNKRDFVIASKQLSDQKLKFESKKKEFNFIAWQLTSEGHTCRINLVIAKKNQQNSFDGHRDDNLTSFIKNKLVKGVPYLEKIDFTYSSSKYLKTKNMIIIILKRILKKPNKPNFTFKDWKDLFKIELKNYQEEEKKTIFENFIQYGKETGLIEVDIKNGDLLKNKYDIKTRAKSDLSKVEKEIYDKLISYEIKESLSKKLEEKKKEIFKKIKKDQATAGVTLSDFTKNEEK